MVLKVYSLSNGMRILRFRHSVDSSYIVVINRAGGRFERPEEAGISHLFEHLTCRDPGLLFEMESLGEGLDNAFTGAEEVSYYFSFPNRNAVRGLELMGNLLTAPIDSDSFALERKVLGVEYLGIRRDPDFVLDDLFLRTAWQGHPLGRTDSDLWEKNLPNLTLEGLLEFRRRVQCGRNTLIAVVGEVRIKDLLGALEKSLGKLPRGKPLVPQSSPLPRREGFTAVKHLRNTEQVHCLLGFPFPNPGSRERLGGEVLNMYMGDDCLYSSALFTKVRNDLGLVYGIWSEFENYYDSGSWTVRWACAPENVELILNIVLGEIEKISRDGLPPQTFRWAREVLALRKESQLSEPITICEALAQDAIRYGKRLTDPKQWPAEARKARRADLMRFVRNRLNPHQAVLAMFGPVEKIDPRIRF